MTEPKIQDKSKPNKKSSLITPEIKSSRKNKNFSKNKLKAKNTIGIPKEVANRMARRVAITSGIPTISGMGVFILSYYIVSRGIADIAPGLTLLGSGLCFLLGLTGLSYGILSASWDKEKGSLLGFENITPNIKRMRSAFISQKEFIKKTDI